MDLRRSGRLPGFGYQGHFVYALTACTFARRPHFANPDVVAEVHRTFCALSEKWGFQLLAYCYMPDHVHLLLFGRAEDADLRGLMHDAKQRTGYRHSRTHGSRLWQESYFDHIVRDEESVKRQACYILANPVRAGLIQKWDRWPYSGTTLDIADEDFQGVISTQP